MSPGTWWRQLYYKQGLSNVSNACRKDLMQLRIFFKKMYNILFFIHFILLKNLQVSESFFMANIASAAVYASAIHTLHWNIYGSLYAIQVEAGAGPDFLNIYCRTGNKCDTKLLQELEYNLKCKGKYLWGHDLAIILRMYNIFRTTKQK